MPQHRVDGRINCTSGDRSAATTGWHHVLEKPLNRKDRKGNRKGCKGVPYGLCDRCGPDLFDFAAGENVNPPVIIIGFRFVVRVARRPE